MATFPAFGWRLRSFAFGVMLLGAASAPVTAQDGIPCPGEPTNMAIVYGDVVSCTLFSGDTDLFTFSGVAGEVIVAIGATACISLAAPSGATAQACATNLASARLDAVLSETGTYTLTASPSGFGTTYTLALERVAPASPRARQLNYGSMLVDDINIVGDVDMFSFTGGAGDTVSIIVSTTDTRWPCIELIAPAGDRSGACVAATSNQIDLLLQQSGTYAILVKQREGQSFQGSWPYSLQLQCVSGACFAAPNPPSGLTGMVSMVATTLIWNAPTTGRPPSSYVVEAGMVSGGTDVLVFDTMSRSTTFMAPGIPNGTYFVRLRSRNSVGTSGPSNEITITRRVRVCAAGRACQFHRDCRRPPRVVSMGAGRWERHELRARSRFVVRWQQHCGFQRGADHTTHGAGAPRHVLRTSARAQFLRARAGKQ